MKKLYCFNSNIHGFKHVMTHCVITCLSIFLFFLSVAMKCCNCAEISPDTLAGEMGESEAGGRSGRQWVEVGKRRAASRQHCSH